MNWLNLIMLDTTQLRRGNWLHDLQHGCYCIVSEVNHKKILVSRYPELIYEPNLISLSGIAIIADNLTLAYFEPGKGNFYERIVNQKYLMIEPLENNLFGWWVNKELIKRIRYWHELQNLFQNSTDELLELNLYGAKH